MDTHAYSNCSLLKNFPALIFATSATGEKIFTGENFPICGTFILIQTYDCNAILKSLHFHCTANFLLLYFLLLPHFLSTFPLLTSFSLSSFRQSWEPFFCQQTSHAHNSWPHPWSNILYFGISASPTQDGDHANWLCSERGFRRGFASHSVHTQLAGTWKLSETFSYSSFFSTFFPKPILSAHFTEVVLFWRTLSS